MLETARDEETEYKENMPENMQDGEKGSAADQAISDLDEAISASESAETELSDSIDELQAIIDRLEGDATSNMDEAENMADSATSS